MYSVVFVPLERLFAHRPEQSTFRRGWRTDLAYFFMSALLLQVTTLLTMQPAMVFFQWAADPRVQTWVRNQPFVVQFLEILVLTDVAQYLDSPDVPRRTASLAFSPDPSLCRSDGLARRLAPAPG